MDEISIRIDRLERRIRALRGVVAILAVAVAALVFGLMPTLRASEVRASRIVLSSPDGGRRSVEISDRGIHLVDHDEGGETWLLAPSRGNDECLAVSSAKGHVGITPGEIRVTGQGGRLVEVKVGGSRPIITILGGKDVNGHVDIGPGFAVVTGTGGSAVIDGRHESLGVRVTDREGQPVAPR